MQFEHYSADRQQSFGNNQIQRNSHSNGNNFYKEASFSKNEHDQELDCSTFYNNKYNSQVQQQTSRSKRNRIRSLSRDRRKTIDESKFSKNSYYRSRSRSLTPRKQNKSSLVIGDLKKEEAKYQPDVDLINKPIEKEYRRYKKSDFDFSKSSSNYSRYEQEHPIENVKYSQHDNTSSYSQKYKKEKDYYDHEIESNAFSKRYSNEDEHSRFNETSSTKATIHRSKYKQHYQNKSLSKSDLRYHLNKNYYYKSSIQSPTFESKRINTTINLPKNLTQPLDSLNSSFETITPHNSTTKSLSINTTSSTSSLSSNTSNLSNYSTSSSSSIIAETTYMRHKTVNLEKIKKRHLSPSASRNDNKRQKD